MATMPKPSEPMSEIDRIMMELTLAQEGRNAPAPMPAAPVSPPAPLEAAMSPAVTEPVVNHEIAAPVAEVAPASKVKRPGLLTRIRQQPGGSKALIALGANLLSSPDFFTGLGRGAMAYQNTLDEEAEKLKPKHDLEADGAFEVTYDPVTGKRQYKRTPIADFTDSQIDRKLESSRLIAGARTDAQLKMNEDDNATQLEIQKLKTQAEETARLANETHDIRMAELKSKLERENEGYKAGLELKKIEEGVEPPPASVAKMVGEYSEAVDSTRQTLSRIDRMIGYIDNGDLSLSLPNNVRHRGALLTGIGVNEETRKYAELQGLVRNMQNALLILNLGVQTDGDADRALAEIMQGGDETTVRRALAIAKAEIERRMRSAERTVNEMRSTYKYGNRTTSPTKGRTPSGVRWRVVE